jgi:hypothetical protein
MKLPDQLTQFGYVGERRALALLCLGVYATLFGLMSLIAMSQLPEWVACFVGLALCYGLGFFAVAADWFWGRWFATGLGYSGLTLAILSVVATQQVLPQMMVYGAMHGLIALCLAGEKMAAAYEARPEWRARFQLDDAGVLRIRRSVTRAAASLPSLIMWALAPRDGAALAVLALGLVGLVGLLRGRTWGLLAIAVAGAWALASSLSGAGEYFYTIDLGPLDASALTPALCAAASGALLLTAVQPFARPLLARLRASREIE